MKSYIALMHRPEATSYWGVTFPDFPGCTSAGATFEEAFANAKEALAGHVAAMRADGDAIPEPSQFDAALLDMVFAEEIAGGAMPTFVDLVDIPAPKERINIMIDPGVLRLVDEAARAEGVSRSAYIERAAASFTSTPFRNNPARELEHLARQVEALANEAKFSLTVRGDNLTWGSETGEFRSVGQRDISGIAVSTSGSRKKG